MKPIKIRASLIIILSGLAINLIGVRLATGFGWWVYIDSIGTVLAAALGGLLPGVIVGFASNFINGIADPITLYYGLINVLIAAATVLLVYRGMFKKLWTTLLCAIPLALIGGGLGSLLTWMLYGFDFGTGITAPIALYLYDVTGCPKMIAQICADMSVDIIDKLITLAVVYIVLKLLPKKVIDGTPNGEAITNTSRLWQLKLRSLRGKIVILIAVTAIILSAMAVTISFLIYKDTMDERYAVTGQNVTALASGIIDADAVELYLKEGENAEGYLETKEKLEYIKSCTPDIKYLYVYQIREDGCHVVFDLDTEDTPGAEPGSVQGIDTAFEEYLPTLFAGGEIEPIIAHGSFGWLLTVYKPIYDSQGQCAAYVAADIAMENVLASRYIFVIRMISLLFGASIIIIALAIVYAQKKLVEPLDALANATDHFAYDNESERRLNTQRIQSLNLHTGDEIENLSLALAKTAADMSGYIDQVAERNRFIAKLQDNIILSFANMVENRDENTGQHIKHTAAYVQAIGNELIIEGKYPDKLDRERLSDFVRSAPLHDIGKIKIPDAILNKPGRLTPEEFDIIKTHTTAGGVILREAMQGIEASNYLNCAFDMAVSHHERWDGGGYPAGLSGDDIPLCARIMAIADVFDALISRRSYKEPFTIDKAVEIIKADSGTHFDPVVVEAFLNVLPEIKELR